MQRSAKSGASARPKPPGLPRRPKVDPFSGEDPVKIDYKNMRLLSRFISDRGKIVPRRISGISAKNQRRIAQAIKRARFLALIPYISG